MKIIVLMMHDTPIGVYRTTKGVKNRIRSIQHEQPGFHWKKSKGQLKWTVTREHHRMSYYWTEVFELRS